MCEMTTLMVASMAISAASAYSSYRAQSDSAKQQTRALQKEGDLQQMDLARQAQQQAEAGTDDMNAAARAAQADLATFDVIAGEFGGGNSAERARTIQEVQQGEHLATISRNASTGMSETAFSANAARERNLSQLRSVRAPSKLAMGLQIAGAAVDTYSTYKQRTRKQ
jgi:hypothetical protein